VCVSAFAWTYTGKRNGIL